MVLALAHHISDLLIFEFLWQCASHGLSPNYTRPAGKFRLLASSAVSLMAFTGTDLTLKYHTAEIHTIYMSVYVKTVFMLNRMLYKMSTFEWLWSWACFMTSNIFHIVTYFRLHTHLKLVIIFKGCSFPSSFFGGCGSGEGWGRGHQNK